MVADGEEKGNKPDFVANVIVCFFQVRGLTAYLTSCGAEGSYIYIPHQDAQYHSSGLPATLGSCSLLFSFYRLILG